jgi:uncharacterized repeat protein (TIGR01451 family)
VDFLGLPTGAGTATINLTMTEFSGNLHARVTVYNSVGVVVTNAEAVDDSFIGMTSVSLTFPVAASQYYIAISGVGSADPLIDGYSSYASLGQYTLSVTAPPGAGTVGVTPQQPYGTNLAKLNGGNPNGYWFLFVQDDAPLDAGVISNGWALTLTTADRVGTAADVAVYTSASPGTVSVGSNLVFTVSVTNYGPSASSNIIVADALPFGAGVVVSSNLTQGTLAQNGAGLTWNVGTLDVLAGAQLTFTVRPAFVGNIFNSVSVTAGTTDPNPDDDTAEVGVNVVTYVPPPQLTGVIIPNPGFIQFSVTNGTSPVIIQSSTNLVNWVNLATNTPPFNYLTPTINPPVQFFRVLLAP